MDLQELVPGRFIVRYDKALNTFRILDTWHESIKNLNLEENPVIPDESPALKTLSTEEVNALVGELIKLGWLDKMISAKSGVQEVTPQSASPVKDSRDLIVEKITEITLDDGNRQEPHSSVSRDAIMALKEIASKI
jgi:hypothetical protein